MKRINVFLGGYVNFLNAQNINCRALSEHLDQNRFKVSTMLFPVHNALDFKPVDGVRYIRCRRPVRIWQYIAYMIGIASANVAYLPKGDIDGFCRTVAKLFGTKVFTTVEGMIDDLNIGLVGMNEKTKRKFISHFAKYEPNLYAITKHIATDVSRRRGYKFSEQVLYLGVNSKQFETQNRRHNALRNIVFIGSTPSIKNVYDLFDAAMLYPDIQFHMVGGNILKEGLLEDYLRDNGLSNVIYHGRLDHSRLSELLAEMDLMYFPSLSEGFPKVHLETACAGVPTLCYGDYGAREWITSWENGIVVDTKEEAFSAIQRLIDEPETLQRLSANAVELGKRFDWEKLTPVWEKEIERIYNS